MFYPTPYFFGSSSTVLLIALIGVMLLGMFAQMKVQSTFKKYSSVRPSSGLTADELAKTLLKNANSFVTVKKVSGSLTDHYNPKENSVGLSESVYGQSSVAALAVAAHEIGHVMQYEGNYLPIKIRNAVLPVAQIGSQASPFIVILGLLFSSYYLAMAGVILFFAVFLFQLITLPVEFNASRRAITMLEEGNFLSYNESDSAKKVLRAASFTYVVAALSTIVTLLRLLLIARSADNRRDS
ncbi:MAG: zinc metallopeptidase [Clostridia bacterium]